MDMHNEHRMAFGEILSQIGSRKVVVGAKQLRKALNSNSVFCVFVAENADPAITDPIVELCQSNCVQYAWVKTMVDLGKACGIEVGAAAAAAVNS